ncbi:MAG: hypothetical protein IT435_13860 [Phycisphaerales bacterium]|nr:hypothetical protein [Phycisphaerales bacterium]
MSRLCMLSANLAVVAAIMLPSLVQAQTPAQAQPQKPNPPPLEPYVEPVLDVGMWARAYELANRPRLLVLAGHGTDRHQAMDPGQVLSNLDAGGITHKIRSALIAELNAPGADIEFVDDNALRAAASRLRENAALAGDSDASQLIGQQLGADQFILARLMKSDLPGSPFSVVVENSDLARGRKGASFPFDWKGGTDVVNIKANARAVAIKLTNDFAERANNPVRYSVQLFGLTTIEMQSAAAETLNAMPGLRGQVRPRTGGTVKDGDTGKAESFNEYEIAFVRGNDPDAAQLSAELAGVLRTRYNLVVEPRQSEAGRIALRVREGTGGMTKGASVPSTAPPSPAPVTAQDLGKLYTDRGSPRIAVLVNRAATINEMNEWRRSRSESAGLQTTEAGGGIVVLGAAGSGQPGASPGADVDPAVLEAWARQVEQTISQSLEGQHGVTRLVSSDLTRASLLPKLDQGQKYAESERLVELLRAEQVAEIAIVGMGRVVSGIAGNELVYTFETIDLSSGNRLGAAIVTAPWRAGATAEALSGSSADVGGRAVGQSVTALRDAWSR